MRDATVQASGKEANEHAFELSFGMLTMLAAYGSVLAALAYFGVPIAWLVVAGFLFSTVIVCNVIIDGIRHLDAGRLYLQQPSSAASPGK
jgi:fatty acid desaturase